jgi:hypothetical protein
MVLIESHVNAIEKLVAEAKVAAANGENDKAVALVQAVHSLNKWLRVHVKAVEVVVA